ncbi:uncharacterized protein EI90DRAFT_3055628 [Cantharellus anzutake]|uniref:uncharacterized protein n=1 Tax=Cantharellus anzutake TaxID=1750568 RepID=UPI0019073E13|nr:uncharacterized protein EI90DRAFT_3055628 [Cantharellus anzutake]KAF8331850.1 hypothetical protein EI90DRAFT_3055628 [Cantharellus anzutake]
MRNSAVNLLALKTTTSREALRRISSRTGTPISSLLASFIVLHEITAIVPFVGAFYTFRQFSVGEVALDKIVQLSQRANPERSWGHTVHGWIKDGEELVGRVGARYGIWAPESSASLHPREDGGPIIRGVAADAVLAYVATKAILPLRIGLSLYLSPSFSRHIIQPLQSALWRAIR